MKDRDLKAWFVSDVLPLERSLMQFLRHNWRNKDDLADLRQEIYLRVYEHAQKQIPHPAKPFVFAIARNLLIDRYRRARIIPIEGVPDLEAIDIASEEPGPDRSVIARDELRHLQAALDQLPPRCRQAVILKRVKGLSRQEIAERMGISERTVNVHLVDGANFLIEAMQSGLASGKVRP
jgi:RNA polymerase sigma-70 factor (ECF subfamily)